MSKKQNWTILATFGVLILIAWVAGAYITRPRIPGWYETINKPSFNPPNWIFGPVWTVLYILIGVSAFMVWRTKGKGKKRAFAVFAVQMVLNFLWTAIFFGLNSLAFAAIEIVVLLGLIAWNIVEFWKINKKAAYLLIPYALWVSFAALLSISVWILNM